MVTRHRYSKCFGTGVTPAPLVTRFLLVLLCAIVTPVWIGATAPQSPRELRATVAGNTVMLTWERGAGGDPLGFIVEAALSPGGSPVASFLVLTPSLVLTQVPDGIYFVRVRAGNADGISSVSGEVAVAVGAGSGACPYPPDRPSDLAAQVSGALVTLKWSGAPGCAAAAYVVHVGSARGLSDLAIITTGAVTAFSASAPPGTYYVRIVAVNAYGTSAASDELTVTVSSAAVDLTGVWTGTSDYPNAPFTFTLVQRGDIVSGTYRDQKDFGGVAGTVTGTRVLLDVNFGDTGIRFEGTLEEADSIRGTIRVPVLGRSFGFQLRR